jgi:hypothetical protein
LFQQHLRTPAHQARVNAVLDELSDDDHDEEGEALELENQSAARDFGRAVMLATGSAQAWSAYCQPGDSEELKEPNAAKRVKVEEALRPDNNPHSNTTASSELILTIRFNLSYPMRTFL